MRVFLLMSACLLGLGCDNPPQAQPPGELSGDDGTAGVSTPRSGGATLDGPLRVADDAAQPPTTGVAPALPPSSGRPPAALFAGLDENMQPVDMAEMIEGRPLVLITGSAS